MAVNLKCAVCNETYSLLDVVALDKSCEKAKRKFHVLSGVPVHHRLCDSCGSCFSSEMVILKMKRPDMIVAQPGTLDLSTTFEVFSRYTVI